MSQNNYFADLQKMYVTEAMGACFYKSMASKLTASRLRDTYLKLGLNERRMMSLLDEELCKLNIRVPKLKKNMAIALLSTIFVFAPLVMQQRFLARVSKKKIFGRWHSMYHDQNEELWEILLEHERMQYIVLVEGIIGQPEKGPPAL